MIVFSNPSKPDAELLTREEKQNMLFFVNAVSVFADTLEGLEKRLGMIDNGVERAKRVRDEGVALVEELRTTIPTKQRVSLRNKGMDLELRMVPKYTPFEKCDLIPKEDLEELVDAAQIKCRECTLTPEESKGCALFKVFANVTPMPTYEHGFLCVYNMAEWEKKHGK